MHPITDKELQDLKKIGQATGTSSYYENKKTGQKFSVSDVATGKVKLPSKGDYTTASKGDEIKNDPNWGIKDVRGAGGQNTAPPVRRAAPKLATHLPPRCESSPAPVVRRCHSSAPSENPSAEDAGSSAR